MKRLAIVLPFLVPGCSKEPAGNPFGASTSPVTSAGSSADDPGEDDESSGGGDSSSGSDAAESSSTSGAGSTSDAESSSGAVDPVTTGVDPTDGGGGQPPTGQYSHCLEGNDCMGVTLCVQIQMDMTTIDGFCSTYPCANAAVDCDPAPGGTAQPICFPMNVNGMDTSACALDCGAGQTCPTGMQCFDLGTGSICA